MRIYVGNLPYSASDNELREWFGPFGDIDSANVIMDKFTGQSRGFGFVEMSNDEQARAAIAALNGREIGGRALRVNEAEARPDRGSGGGGGGRGGYGGGGGGGGRGGYGGDRY